MKVIKPKFWDYKKPNIASILLNPFTIPIRINNFFNKIKKKIIKIKILKLSVLEIFTLVELEKHLLL